MSLRSRVYALRIKAGSWIAGRSLDAYYNGASTSRLFYDWAAGVVSPNQKIRADIRTLRDRARDLEDNSALIAGFLREVESNVIGPDGILLHAKVANSAGDLIKKTNFSIEEAWKRWGQPENASLSARDSWVDIQHQLVRRRFIDGEIIIRKHKGADNEFGFAVQLIDPDLLDETYDVPPNSDGVEIVMGVEQDRDEKVLAYHMFKAHPAELARRGLTRERVRIEASEIIHHFRRTRPGQTRGVTELAPVLTTLKMLDGYTEAELVAMRFAASKMGFITNNTELAAQAFQAPKPGDPAKKIEIAPGLVDELGIGKGFETFDPTHPNASFVEFTKLMQRMVARAFGVSFLTLTGDVREANYSSMRAGLLPEREHWRLVQKWTATQVHRPIYLAWLPQALLTGMIHTDNRVASQISAHEWKPRGWKWVDPANDLDALEKEISLGVNSRQRACAERGVDFEDVIDEIREEEDYASEQKVDVGGTHAEQTLGEKRADRDEKRKDADARHLAIVETA